MANLATVQQIYEAFGKGDVPTILSHLAEDVVWEYGVNSTDVPWLQPRRGRAQVTAFFEALADFEIRSFVPKSFFEAGDEVVVLVDLDATVRSTGRPVVEEDEVHIWRFDSRGQVRQFRHRADTHQQWKAFKGQ